MKRYYVKDISDGGLEMYAENEYGGSPRWWDALSFPTFTAAWDWRAKYPEWSRAKIVEITSEITNVW